MGAAELGDNSLWKKNNQKKASLLAMIASHVIMWWLHHVFTLKVVFVHTSDCNGTWENEMSSSDTNPCRCEHTSCLGRFSTLPLRATNRQKCFSLRGKLNLIGLIEHVFACLATTYRQMPEVICSKWIFCQNKHWPIESWVFTLHFHKVCHNIYFNYVSCDSTCRTLYFF